MARRPLIPNGLKMAREQGRPGLLDACRAYLLFGMFPPVDPKWAEIAEQAVLTLVDGMAAGEVDYRTILQVDGEDVGALGMACVKLRLDPLIEAIQAWDALQATGAEP